VLTIENLTEYQRLVLYFLLVSPVISIIVCGALIHIIEYLDGFFGIGSYYDNNPIRSQNNGLANKPQPNQYITKPPVRVDMTGTGTGTKAYKGIQSYERAVPPRPTFFGRFDGKEVISYGEFDPTTLNYWEKVHWQDNEATIRAEHPPVSTKSPEVLEKFGIVEQNQDIASSEELFEDEKPILAKPRAYRWAK
jgi:hypothetical protein